MKNKTISSVDFCNHNILNDTNMYLILSVCFPMLMCRNGLQLNTTTLKVQTNVGCPKNRYPTFASSKQGGNFHWGQENSGCTEPASSLCIHIHIQLCRALFLMLAYLLVCYFLQKCSREQKRQTLSWQTM